MKESRIGMNDSFAEIVTKMSDGNPGAARVVIEMLQPESNKIDPDSTMGGMMKVLALDSLGIYGTDIYVLYNDICDRDMIKTFTILRSHQLGFLDGSVLKDACSRQDRSGRGMVNVGELYKKVKEELPEFGGNI